MEARTHIPDRHDPFLVLAVAYFAVGLLAVVGRLGIEVGLVDSLPRIRWTMVHLVTIGGMTQALFGVLPGVLTDGGPGDAGSRWLEWLLLNAGYPLVLVGMTTSSTLVALTGATLVAAAVLVLFVELSRADLAVSTAPFFRAAPWFLVVGISMAFGLLLAWFGPGGYFGTIEAHVHANVWGFLALIVAGTLLLVVSQLGEDEGLAYPRLERVTFWGLLLGASGLVAGPWLALHVLTFGGLAVYVVGTVALLANVVATARAAGRVRTPRIAHVLGAYTWLVIPVPFAPFVLLFPDVVPGAIIERAAITGLVFGWMLQLAMAFLPAALVAARERTTLARALDRAPAPGWLGVLAANLGLAALWLRVAPLAEATREVLFVGGYGLVALAWAAFLWSLWRALAGPGERGASGQATDPAAGAREAGAVQADGSHPPASTADGSHPQASTADGRDPQV